jgi:hypothetical protein
MSRLRLSKQPIGYRGETDGAVTQATSKSTAVTMNALHGLITMHNASLAAGAGTTVGIVSFDLNNALIEAGDTLILNHISGGTVGRYHLNAQCQAGKAVINVYNMGTDAIGEAIVIKFVLIKAPTAG